MSQNRSHAVMSQRVEAHDSLDHFPTPPWATRALCEWLIEPGDQQIGLQSCWEPACAEGHMARPLAEYFRTVHATDINDYGFGLSSIDFLWPGEDKNLGWDWIITNPPFRLGEQFAVKGLAQARNGVALLVRTAFLESADRYEALFKERGPTEILQFVERVPMFKGRLDRHGSTATSYCWLVWRMNAEARLHQTAFHWLAPCRKRLERDSDYPPIASAAE